MPISPLRRYRAAAPLLVVVALVTASCGADDGADGANGGGAAQPSVQTPTAGLPPRLASNLKQGDQIIGEGKDVFDRRLRELRGHPVVVNQWASWCPPCRAEFPIFQRLAERYAGRVAFLGVDMQDDREAALAFMSELATPYPHYFDEDASISRLFGGGRVSPTTGFYDARGKLVFSHLGAYADDAQLEAEIRRYALR